MCCPSQIFSVISYFRAYSYHISRNAQLGKKEKCEIKDGVLGDEISLN